MDDVSGRRTPPLFPILLALHFGNGASFAEQVIRKVRHLVLLRLVFSGRPDCDCIFYLPANGASGWHVVGRPRSRRCRVGGACVWLSDIRTRVRRRRHANWGG